MKINELTTVKVNEGDKIEIMLDYNGKLILVRIVSTSDSVYTEIYDEN